MFGGLLVGELSSGTKETACLYLQSQISSSLCGFLHRITVSVSACPLWPTGPTSGKSYLTAHHAERKAKDETDWCCTHTHTHTHLLLLLLLLFTVCCARAGGSSVSQSDGDSGKSRISATQRWLRLSTWAARTLRTRSGRSHHTCRLVPTAVIGGQRGSRAAPEQARVVKRPNSSVSICHLFIQSIITERLAR